MTYFRSKTIVFIGFVFILLSLLTVIFAWINNAAENTRRIQQVVDEQAETRLISIMLHAVHERALALYMMSTVNDPFQQDEAYIKFRQLGEKYLKARASLLAGNIWAEELAAIHRVDKLAAFGGTAQEKIAELIHAGEQSKAQRLLSETILPNRMQISGELADVIDSQRQFVEHTLDETVRQNETIYLLIFSLGSVAFFLGLFTVFVVRKLGRTEAELIDQGDRVQALYEVSSISGLSIDEQIDATLKLGCDLLGLEIGKVCRIDSGKQTNTFVNTVAPPEYNVTKGAVIALEKTFCSLTFQADDTIQVNHVRESQYKNYRCYEFSHLEAYIAAPIWVGGEKYGTVNFSSLSPRKNPFNEKDKELIKLIGNWVSVNLERQIAQEVALAKEVAEKANKTKSTFLANMSHELRTPLNAILGYNELMQEQATEDRDTKYLDDIAKINKAGRHLLALISDILDLSKIEAGKMQFIIESFEFKPLLDNIEQTIQPMAKKNNNVLSIHADERIGPITSDATKVQQILYNLLSNACKFTQNGRIDLDARIQHSSSGQQLVMAVKDTGIGIAEDQIEKLFVSFSQGDSSIVRRYGGTGLGLAISMKLCEMLGGSISVTSKINEGSTFVVTLPVVVEASHMDQCHRLTHDEEIAV